MSTLWQMPLSPMENIFFETSFYLFRFLFFIRNPVRIDEDMPAIQADTGVLPVFPVFRVLLLHSVESIYTHRISLDAGLL